MAKSALPRKFCENQIECSDRKGVYSCMGHLADGYVPVCDFNENQIYVENYADNQGKAHYQFKIKTKRLGGDGVCRDFEIVPKIGREILRGLEGQIKEQIRMDKIGKMIANQGYKPRTSPLQLSIHIPHIQR